MIENVKRYRTHTSHGMDVGKLICILYAVTALLMLVPYAKYAAWILPLVFLYREKESDFAIFMFAQLFSLAAVVGALAFLFEVPLKWLIRRMSTSLAFGWVLAGDFASFLTSILAAFVGLAAVILTLMAASRALRYVEAHIILAGPMAERITALPRFKD